MSRTIPTAPDLAATLKRQVAQGDDPWLTITEVAVITKFHRRTLQRYVDERILPHERRGPKARVFIRWSVVRKHFPQDTRGI